MRNFFFSSTHILSPSLSTFPSPPSPSLSTMSANEKERGPDDIQVEPSTPVEETKKKREYKDFGHEEEQATRKSHLAHSHPPPEGLTLALQTQRLTCP